MLEYLNSDFSRPNRRPVYIGERQRHPWTCLIAHFRQSGNLAGGSAARADRRSELRSFRDTKKDDVIELTE